MTLAIPSGWTAPSTTSSNNGYTTASAGTGCTLGTLSVLSQTITVPITTCGAGDSFTITYGANAGATAQSGTGTATFTTSTQQGSSGLAGIATQPTVTVNATTASKLVYTTAPPTTTTAGTTFGVVVKEEDTYSNVETGDSTTTLTLSANNGGGGFSCTTTPTHVTAGVATYSGCSYTVASATAYTLTAASSPLVSATANTTVSPTTASKLVYTTAPPTTTTAGTTFGVVVKEEDTYSNVETGDSTTTLTLSANNGGGGFSCTTTPTHVTAGVATYSGCSYTVASATAYTLTAASSPLVSATANTTVSPTTASKLVYTTAPPTTTTAGTTFGVVVKEEDTYSNVETGDSTTTLTLSANNGGGGFSCTTTPTHVTAGVATYSGCSYTVASATAYTLTAASSPLVSATANTTVSASMSNDMLVFVAEPPTSNTYSGVAMSPAVTVQVEDTFGNPVSYSSGEPTVTLSLSSGTITSGGSATTSASGLATFNALIIGSAGANLTLSASSTGMTSATSNPFTVSVLVRDGATLTDQATDAGSGVASVTYYYCSGFTGGCSPGTSIGTSTSGSGNSWSYTWSSGQPADGNYQVVAVGTDNVNNTDSVPSASIPVTVDNTSPTVSVTFPVSGSYYNATGWTNGGTTPCGASGTICGQATDGTSGIPGRSSIALTISQGSLTWNGSSFVSGTHTVNPTSYNAGTGLWTYTFANTNLTNGDGYTVAVTATDGAGNTSSPATSSFTYSTTAPTITVSAPTNGTTYGANWGGSINGTASGANGASISSVKVSVQQGSGSCWTGSGNTWTATCQNYLSAGTTPWSLSLPAADLNSGDTYHVSVQATDSAGNVTTSTLTFTYSTTAPTITVSAPTNGTTYGANWGGSINGTASGANGASISSVKVSVQQGSGSCWTGSGNTWTATCQNYLSAGTTPWSLSLPAADLNSGDTYHVSVQATDSAGNVTTSTLTFTYSTTAPTITVSAPTNGTTYGANWGGSINGTASGANGASISSVKVSVQQGSGSCWTGSGNTWTATCQNYLSAGTTPWSLSLPAADLNSGDTYTVSVQATDSAGNVTTSTLTFTYEAITFVQQVVAPGGASLTTQTLSLPNATTTGDTLILTVGDDYSHTATVSSVSGGGVPATGSGSWTKVTETNGSSGDGEAEIWYGQVTSGGTTAITVTLSGSTNWQLANVSEWAGIASSSPVDASTSSNGSATSFTAGPITTTQAGDLVISDAWTSFNSPGFTSPQNSTTLGYTALSQTMAGGSYYRAWGAYTIDSSTGSISAGWTGPGSGFYATAIAAFKP